MKTMTINKKRKNNHRTLKNRKINKNSKKTGKKINKVKTVKKTIRKQRKKTNKSRKYKNRPIKNIQRGGRIVKLTDEQLKSWVPLECRTGMDCGPNVFTLLGYTPRETAEFLGKLTPKGIHPWKVLEWLNEAFDKDGKDPHVMEPIIKKDYNPARVDKEIDYKISHEFIDALFTENGMATLMGLHSEGGGGHFVAFYKNMNGEYEILDAQSQQRFIGFDEIKKYMARGQFDRAFIYYQLSKIKVKVGICHEAFINKSTDEIRS
jgi:hypothetical protein